MSITRQQLKSIVKECLVEILAEGIGSSTKQSIQESSSKKTNTTISQKQPLSPRRGEHVKYSKTMAETIKREAGGNSVMAAIFADTAATTLPTMLNESTAQPQPVGSIERAVAQSTPEELFGDDAASKWADLAFMETSKKF